MATLVMKEKYESEIRSKIQKELDLKNEHQIPKLDKIVINFGLGESATNGKALENAIKDLTEISGQKPVITRAKKSIATFKVREGMALGLKVTLRKEKMYNFFSKLVNVALPRVRDFQGLSPKSFDGKGNYTFGVKEQLIFPEIKYDQVDAVRGMDIIICTSSPDNAGARALLKAFGFPFKKDVQIKEGM